MHDRIAQRLAALQQEQAQTQQALAHLEQQRQGLLQQLLQIQGGLAVLQELVDKNSEPPAVYCPAGGRDGTEASPTQA